MNNSIQIAGGLFGSSRLESSIKDLNNALKLELESIKIGAGHRFATRIRLEVDEKRSDIYEIINSDFEEKRKFYTILNQWAEKYGKKPIDKKHPFEVFIQDLQSVFGKNETSMRDKEKGERTIYDDLDFYKLPPLKVLLVDDFALNLMVGAALLEPKGHAVATASSGQKAVEMASNNDYDIILMDVHMPDMDGMEATKAIRNSANKRRAAVPIVALSADVEVANQASFIASGMNAALSKSSLAKGFDKELQRILKLT